MQGKQNESEVKIMLKFNDYFCGKKISDYGMRNGFVDYRTFASCFDAVLNNDLMGILENQGFYFENENMVDNSEKIEELEEHMEEVENQIEELEELELDEKSEEYAILCDLKKELEEIEEEKEELENSYEKEVFQWFIVSDNGAQLIKEFTNDPLYYNSELDIYFWGVTHYGTSWDYVLTDIPCNCKEE